LAREKIIEVETKEEPTILYLVQDCAKERYLRKEIFPNGSYLFGWNYDWKTSGFSVDAGFAATTKRPFFL